MSRTQRVALAGGLVWPFVLGGGVLVAFFVPGNLALAVLLWMGEALATGRDLGDEISLWYIVAALVLNVAIYLLICGITLARVRGSPVRRQRAMVFVWLVTFVIGWVELVAALVVMDRAG